MNRRTRYLYFGYVQCPSCGRYRGTVTVEVERDDGSRGEDLYVSGVCHDDPMHAVEYAEIDFKLRETAAALERGGDVEFIDLDTDTRG